MVHELTRTLPPDYSPPVGPVRTCVGCRERATKSELLRIVVGSGAEGQMALVPDLQGSAAGRGTYVHPTTGCFELAVRRRAFSRALRVEVGVTSSAVGEHLAARSLEL